MDKLVHTILEAFNILIYLRGGFENDCLSFFNLFFRLLCPDIILVFLNHPTKGIADQVAKRHVMPLFNKGLRLRFQLVRKRNVDGIHTMNIQYLYMEIKHSVFVYLSTGMSVLKDIGVGWWTRLETIFCNFGTREFRL